MDKLSCARCGHWAPSCPRCGERTPFLGYRIGPDHYCHTVSQPQPSCYSLELADRAVARNWAGEPNPFRVPYGLWEEVEGVMDGLEGLLKDSTDAWDVLMTEQANGQDQEDINLQVQAWLFELRRAVVALHELRRLRNDGN